MALEKIFGDDVYVSIKKALDGAMLRQKALSQNIANVDTPGYKRADVTFEDELKAALEKSDQLPLKITDNQHIPNTPLSAKDVFPQTIIDNDTFMRNDINNVDIDKETSELTENNMLYNSLVQIIDDKLRSLRNVIREGK